MNTSTPSKRIKLDPSLSPSSSPSPNDENSKESDDLEQVHCTICLQSFLDRTIIPVCAHEFCFECILLWSEQSRKCPLCSRSFDNSYLIHHIRSQYDYQKHYLLPSRSSPLPPPLTDESRVNALRNTRRARQWGRRQRQQREEADQLERAIARRRWIYQHHLYAKHIASNPYTRYRPFPTPAQFTASPDLISRITIFLRRELRVWPNLDVEFLTTYTISLMKSIDIRSESAVKLLSEFLDLDTPYTAGERHVNAEHFAHEIYSYLRSPYRDLNTYDQTAQYDTPPEIFPPQEIERGSRWSAERSQSRSRSHSRDQSSILYRQNSTRHGRASSAEARREDKPSVGHSRNRPPRSIPPDREGHDPRNHPSGRRHSPPDGVQDILRNDHSGGMSHPENSSSAVLAENQDNNFPVQSHSRGNEKGKGQGMGESVPATDATKMSAPQGDDSAAVGEADVTRLIDGPPEGTTGDDYVDKARDGSSASPQPSRKRSAGLSVHIHPRNRTLSESVQAYLARPAAPRHPTKKPSVSGDEQPICASDTGTTGRSTTDTRPSLLRLTDGRNDPDIGKLPPSRKTTVGTTANGDPSTPNDAASEQRHHDFRSQSCVFLPNRRCSSTAAKHANTVIQCGDEVDNGATLSRRFLPSTDEASGISPSADRSPGWLGFPPVPSVTPLTRNANVALSHALASEGSLVDGRLEAVRTRHGEPRGPGRRFHMEMGAARSTGDEARSGAGVPTNDDALHLHSDLLGRYTLSAASASLDDHDHDHKHKHSRTDMDTWPGVEVSTDAIAAAPPFFLCDRSTACEGDDLAVGGLHDDTSMNNSTVGCGSGSVSTSTSTSTDVGASELETRLRARARLHVRLAAMKGAGTVVSVGSASVSGTGSRLTLGTDSGSKRRGVTDDSTVRRTDHVRDPSVGVALSGGLDADRDGDGSDEVRDWDGIGDDNKDKDKVGYEDKRESDRDKQGKSDRDRDRDEEREREVALKGMLRERVARRG